MVGVLVEVNAFFELVKKANTVVTHISDGLYKASKAMMEFPLHVQRLSEKKETWSERLSRYGMADDASVKSTLHEVNKLLEQQTLELTRSQSSNCCVRLTWKSKTLLFFPEELTTKMGEVVASFERIPSVLRENSNLDKEFGNLRLSQKVELPFKADIKYVPLEETVRAVREALESESSRSQVVVLYGGSGMGKSSMVKHLGLLYQSGLPVVQSRNQQAQRRKWFQDGVFFLHCGPEAVKGSKDLLVQLWKDLAFHSLTTTAIKDNSPNKNTGDSEGEKPNSVIITPLQSLQASESRLKVELTALLKSQNLLIILDDVYERELIENLLLPTAGIKYLVTSRSSGVWQDAELIQIEKPNPKDARKIVGSHVKAFHGDVPEELQDEVDKIVEKCGYDPLCLANVAMKVRSRHANEIGEWKRVKRNLADMQDGDPYQPATIFGRSYTLKTKPNAIAMFVESFSTETQTLLFLAALCESQNGVPEVAIKILFGTVHSLACFWGSYETLTDSDYINIERKSVPWSDIPHETFSIHDRYREFVLKNKKDEVEEMVEKLLNNSSTPGDRDVVCAILVLYGQNTWRDKAASILEISIDQNRSSRLACPVEPFVWLLHAGGYEEWQKQSHEFATQIILSYLRRGELDDHGMSQLLAMKETAADSCGALYNMALLVKGSLLTVQHERTVKGLLEILRIDHREYVDKRAAMEALWNLVENQVELGSVPGAVEGLVGLLAKDVSQVIQIQALRTFERLSLSKSNDKLDNTCKIKIGSVPGAVEGLVRFLADDSGQPMKQHAARTLANIMWNVVDNQVKVGSVPGAVEGLIGLLAKGFNKDVQVQALRGVEILTIKVPDIKLKVGSFPGTVEGLVKHFAEDVMISPEAQVKAIRALGNITSVALENHVKAVKAGSYDAAAVEELSAEKKIQVPARQTLAAMPKAVDRLIKLAAAETNNTAGTGYWATRTLTVFDVAMANQLTLRLAQAYRGRGHAKLELGMHEGALHDFIKGLEFVDITDHLRASLISDCLLVKSMLADYDGALEDANRAVGLFPNEPLVWQERGVLKRMMADLDGALFDLNKSLELQSGKYQALKHRGYTKWLMRDERGAMEDGEMATTLKFQATIWPGRIISTLGNTPVTYSKFKLP